MQRFACILALVTVGCPYPEGWTPPDSGRLPLPADTADTAEPVAVCEGAVNLGYVPYGSWTTFQGELGPGLVTPATGSCVLDRGGLEGESPWPYQIWSMRGDAGQAYRFEIWTDSFQPHAVVLDPACVCMAWGDEAGGHHGATYTMPAQGWVHLFVAARSAEERGSYTIHTPVGY